MTTISERIKEMYNNIEYISQDTKEPTEIIKITRKLNEGVE